MHGSLELKSKFHGSREFKQTFHESRKIQRLILFVTHIAEVSTILNYAYKCPKILNLQKL